MSQPGGYDAFISYSHVEDDALAATLQAGLERFASPWHRPRVLKVFRDTTNLAATPELFSDIVRALEVSDWFVLIASPRAANSRWVRQEIEWWLAHKDHKKFLIALSDGSIKWAGQDFDWEQTDALPAELSGAFAEEPGWADLHSIREAIQQRNAAIQQRNDAASGQLVFESESPGGGNPRISDLEAVTAWRLHPSAQARYAIAEAAARPGIAALTGDTGPIASLVFSPNGKILATGSWDGTVRLWNTATWRPIGRPMNGNISWVYSVAFSPDGKILAAGSQDGKVRLWNVTTRQPIGKPLPGNSTMAIFSVAFSPDGKTLAAGGLDGTVRLWDVATRQPFGNPFPGNTGAVLSVAFSPDGKLVAAGTANSTLWLWDIAAARLFDDVSFTSNTGWMTSLAFSSDGKKIAVGSTSSIVWILDTTTGKAVDKNPLNGHTGPVNSVMFSPNGETLATSGYDGTVRLWKVATGQEIGSPLTGATGEVNSVLFSPDGRTLVSGSGSGDDTVRLWDVATHQEIGIALNGQAGPVNSTAFSPNGEIIAAGDQDGTVQLWNVSYLSNSLQRVCALAGTPFTPSEWVQYVPAGPAYEKVCP